jgi:iron complex outermembrane receptor protein
MNELFWLPGGNPNLKPELGYHGRAGFTLLLGKETRTRWRIEPSVYASRVKDWIQWVPAEGSVWTPVNYRMVQTQGVEIHGVCERSSLYNKKKWRFETRWNMNDVFWVDSTSHNAVRRMIYTPRFTGYQGVSWESGTHAFTLGYRLVSSRYTDEANSSYRALDAYGLCNVWYSLSLPVQKAQMQLSFGIDNVFDVAYETLRAYAMPGRVFRVGLDFSFSAKQKNQSEKTIHLD